jgi:hypothetical protein
MGEVMVFGVYLDFEDFSVSPATLAFSISER